MSVILLSAFSAAKTRSHFSIVPERRGLGGRWQASVRASAPGKLGLHNYTQFHKRHQKALFVIGSILGGLKPASLRCTVRATRGTEFLLLLLFHAQTTSLLHLDWTEGKQNSAEVSPVAFTCTEQMQHVTLNLNNYSRVHFYFCAFKKIIKKKKKKKKKKKRKTPLTWTSPKKVKWYDKIIQKAPRILLPSSILSINCFSREVFQVFHRDARIAGGRNYIGKLCFQPSLTSGKFKSSLMLYGTHH